MIRTLGCLPALIRPPFRCSTVPLQARARNGTTTATLRVIYPATNLGPGRATQQQDRNLRIASWESGTTRVSAVSPAVRVALREHLMGAGELLRANAMTAAEASERDKRQFA